MATQQTSSVIQARVYVLGDNIDTDQIIPAQYLNLVPTIPEEYRKLGTYALSGLPADCHPFIKPGAGQSEYGIIIAGRNFGCGSSREHAPIALGAAGIKAIVAESYARIFFRNAIATGEQYPCETATSLRNFFKTGDEAELRLEKPEIVNIAAKQAFTLKPLGAVGPVVKAGGLFAHARQTGIIKNSTIANPRSAP